MWTRKELKDKAKIAFKANYWKAVLVGLLLAVLLGGFSSFSSLRVVEDRDAWCGTFRMSQGVAVTASHIWA